MPKWIVKFKFDGDWFVDEYVAVDKYRAVDLAKTKILNVLEDCGKSEDFISGFFSGFHAKVKRIS